ncbi:MAG TPA: hypothetical protein VGG08_09755 [Solirubrobacteraceae bacterium]|jgi:hypothetical protein
MDEQQRTNGSRFARRSEISLDEALPELMEAEPGTVIRLGDEQAEQLAEIERAAAGGRFRRIGARPAPSAASKP